MTQSRLSLPRDGRALGDVEDADDRGEDELGGGVVEREPPGGGNRGQARGHRADVLDDRRLRVGEVDLVVAARGLHDQRDDRDDDRPREAEEAEAMVARAPDLAEDEEEDEAEALRVLGAGWSGAVGDG